MLHQKQLHIGEIRGPRRTDLSCSTLKLLLLMDTVRRKFQQLDESRNRRNLHSIVETLPQVNNRRHIDTPGTKD